MERYAVKSRILTSLDKNKSLSELSEDVGITGARLLRLFDRCVKTTMSRAETKFYGPDRRGVGALETPHHRENNSAFSHRSSSTLTLPWLRQETGCTE